MATPVAKILLELADDASHHRNIQTIRIAFTEVVGHCTESQVSTTIGWTALEQLLQKDTDMTSEQYSEDKVFSKRNTLILHAVNICGV